jgi:hypothetical protein
MSAKFRARAAARNAASRAEKASRLQNPQGDELENLGTVRTNEEVNILLAKREADYA